MIQQEWNNKGYPVKTIWKPLETYEDISPIWQVYGVCFTENKEVMIIRNTLPEGGFTPWYIPGGTPENNEKPEETLIREVDEEADISISNLKLLGAFEVSFSKQSQRKKGRTLLSIKIFRNDY